MFVDVARIYIKAGDGGNGCISFRREKYVPFGGPDGGDGGDGGDIVVCASAQLNTLLDFKYQQHYKINPAGDGSGGRRTGKNSRDLEIFVPVGTVILDLDTGEKLADLVEDGERVIVAHGGKGGKGNIHYATATNQAPRQATPGIPGEERRLLLELKLFADIGLVGFPNAGKSTFISRISSARPKIADYPFTTLIPHLGVVKDGSGKSFVIADIPGIVEGAHEGKGLGFQFLKHIERTEFILFMVDISQTITQEDPIIVLDTLMKELELFSPELKRKDFAIAGTKMDVMGDATGYKSLERAAAKMGKEFFLISSVTGDGVPNLVRYLSQTVEHLKHSKRER